MEKGEKAGKAWISAVSQNFAVGLAEARDLSDALVAFFGMRTRYLQAVFDLHIARSALAAAAPAQRSLRRRASAASAPRRPTRCRAGSASASGSSSRRRRAPFEPLLDLRHRPVRRARRGWVMIMRSTQTWIAIASVDASSSPATPWRRPARPPAARSASGWARRAISSRRATMRSSAKTTSTAKIGRGGGRREADGVAGDEGRRRHQRDAEERDQAQHAGGQRGQHRQRHARQPERDRQDQHRQHALRQLAAHVRAHRRSTARQTSRARGRLRAGTSDSHSRSSASWLALQ